MPQLPRPALVAARDGQQRRARRRRHELGRQQRIADEVRNDRASQQQRLAHGHLEPRGAQPLLAALEAGLERLGSVITLEQRALALELALERKDAALDRLERLIAASPQPAQLCYQRGELLESLGRTQAARESYRAGLAALDRLPPGRLRAPAFSELYARLQAAQDP